MNDIKFPVFGKAHCTICAGRGHVRTYASTNDKVGQMEGCTCLKQRALRIMQLVPGIQLDTQFVEKNNIQHSVIVEKVKKEIVDPAMDALVDAVTGEDSN